MKTLLKFKNNIIMESYDKNNVLIEYYNFKLNKKIVDITSIKVISVIHLTNEILFEEVIIPSLDTFTKSLFKHNVLEFLNLDYSKKINIVNNIIKFNYILFRLKKRKPLFVMIIYDFIKEKNFHISDYGLYATYLADNNKLITLNGQNVINYKSPYILNVDTLYSNIYNNFKS